MANLKPWVAPGLFQRGADSSNEGAKVWFSGYYKCQKFPKNHSSPSDRGLACSDGGARALKALKQIFAEQSDALWT